MGLPDEPEAVGGPFSVRLMLRVFASNSDDDDSQALCSGPSVCYSPHCNSTSWLLVSPPFFREGNRLWNGAGC